jgi:hypothetical protein
LIANQITFALGMLTAIDFNNQTLFPPDKVNDIGSNWLLPDEFQSLFSDCGIAAQPSRERLSFRLLRHA